VFPVNAQEYRSIFESLKDAISTLKTQLMSDFGCSSSKCHEHVIAAIMRGAEECETRSKELASEYVM